MDYYDDVAIAREHLEKLDSHKYKDQITQLEFKYYLYRTGLDLRQKEKDRKGLERMIRIALRQK